MGKKEVTTAEQLVRTLTEKKMTCATAESCTGGGVGHAITDVSGASAVFWGGVISYDNSVKHHVLGVEQSILDGVGPVSQPCAEQMAVGVRKLLKTDLAVSITGLAGPGGDGVRPAGYVWFGVATAAGVTTDNQVFPGDRAAVRAAAIEHALSLLLAAAKKVEFCPPTTGRNVIYFAQHFAARCTPSLAAGGILFGGKSEGTEVAATMQNLRPIWIDLG